MTFIAVRCPHCQSDHIVKRGQTARGTQRSLCQNTLCTKGSFRRDYDNRGGVPAGTPTIIDRSLKARGVRDTARSLPIGPHTVLRARKKKEAGLESVHTAVLRPLNPAEVAWDVERAGEAEMDELGALVGHKGTPRGRWHASAHRPGQVLAYGFGRRPAEGFFQLTARLAPCGLTRYSTDHWGAYTRHVDPAMPSPGTQHTPQIERKPLTLRTRIKRLVRTTIGFSKSIQLHDLVIGLFVHRSAFGRAV